MKLKLQWKTSLRDLVVTPLVVSHKFWQTRTGTLKQDIGQPTHADVLRHLSLNHSSPQTWGRNDCMTNALGHLCGRLNSGLHNFWRIICLVCSDQSCKEYNFWSKSKYILIVLSLACKSIISSTSDGTKQSFVQWFVVTAVNNIKHRFINTTVNIQHVVNFGWISS